MMLQIVFTCVIAVTTPQGQVCVKPDGTVDYPKGAQLDQLSKSFWDALAQGYLKELFCDDSRAAEWRHRHLTRQ